MARRKSLFSLLIGGSRRKKSKGFIGSLMSEKSAGVMCGPGGVGARGGKRKR